MACTWSIWSHHDELTVDVFSGFMTAAGRGKHIYVNDSLCDLIDECGHSVQIELPLIRKDFSVWGRISKNQGVERRLNASMAW
jgi:hypothetical protein